MLQLFLEQIRCTQINNDDGIFRRKLFFSALEGLKFKSLLVPVLLMVQKSGDHQLRLVVYPIIYGVL